MNAEQNRRIERLYLEMFDKMMAYAHCSLENEALAEEAVQEAFHIACQKPEELCQSANPQGWLVQALKYTVCNIRHSRATAKRIVEEYLITQLKELAFSEYQPDRSVLYENVADTEECKLLAEMAIEGKSYLEMANSRGISVSACKKRVQRAKETLRRKIDA